MYNINDFTVFDETHIFLASVDEMCNGTTDREMMSILDVGEKETLRKITRTSRFKEYLVGHYCLRYLIGKYHAINPTRVQLKKGVFGKPFIDFDNSITFNMSHSDGIVAIVLASQSAVGIDLEIFGNDRISVDAIPGMARVFCGKDEFDELLAIPLERRMKFFFRIWTRKESLLKAIGIGLTESIKNINVQSLPEGRVWFHHIQSDLVYEIESLSTENSNGFELAICRADSLGRVRLFNIEPGCGDQNMIQISGTGYEKIMG